MKLCVASGTTKKERGVASGTTKKERVITTYVALHSFWYNKKRDGNYPPQGST
jgi:hypothetical protein